MSAKRQLIATCADGRATLRDLRELEDHDRTITYETFAKHVDIPAISQDLGYAHGRHGKGLRLGDDYAVSFYRSRFRGRPCYHLDWSSIDHIFQ